MLSSKICNLRSFHLIDNQLVVKDNCKAHNCIVNRTKAECFQVKIPRGFEKVMLIHMGNKCSYLNLDRQNY